MIRKLQQQFLVRTFAICMRYYEAFSRHLEDINFSLSLSLKWKPPKEQVFHFCKNTPKAVIYNGPNVLLPRAVKSSKLLLLHHRYTTLVVFTGCEVTFTLVSPIYFSFSLSLFFFIPVSFKQTVKTLKQHWLDVNTMSRCTMLTSLVAGSLAGRMGRGPLRAPGSSPRCRARRSSRSCAPQRRTSSWGETTGASLTPTQLVTLSRNIGLVRWQGSVVKHCN